MRKKHEHYSEEREIASSSFLLSIRHEQNQFFANNMVLVG